MSDGSCRCFNPCEQELYVTGQKNGSNNYQANKITSNANIQSGTTVFEAQTEIVLEADFEVALGAAFTADIFPCAGAAAWRYEYFLQDHLGNNRVLFADKNGNNSIETDEILQENHYYAFGMAMEGDWQVSTTPDNRYRYNGKEFNDDIGLYDYGARWYDPAIARWTSIDPLASSMASWSPYNYVFNNPLKYTDPTGMAPFTDYYNQNGKHVKNVDDGSDAKVMVMTTSKKADVVDAAIQSGQTGPVASDAALEQMDAAYDATAENGNERGFAVATDGTTSSMVEGETGEVDVVPARNELFTEGKTVAYDVHTHPEGNEAETVGSPEPSGADMSGAATTDPQNSVVLGFTRTVTTTTKSITSGTGSNSTTTTSTNRTIGFYNGSGSTGTMNYRRYRKIARKINKAN